VVAAGWSYDVEARSIGSGTRDSLRFMLILNASDEKGPGADRPRFDVV